MPKQRWIVRERIARDGKRYKTHHTVPEDYVIRNGKLRDKATGEEYTEKPHTPSFARRFAVGAAPTIAGAVGASLLGGQRGAAQGVGNVGRVAANIYANQQENEYPDDRRAALRAGAAVTGADRAAEALISDATRTGSLGTGLGSAVPAGIQGALEGAAGMLPGGNSVAQGIRRGLPHIMGRKNILRGLAEFGRGVLASPTLADDIPALAANSNPADYNRGTWGANARRSALHQTLIPDEELELEDLGDQPHQPQQFDNLRRGWGAARDAAGRVADTAANIGRQAAVVVPEAAAATGRDVAGAARLGARATGWLARGAASSVANAARSVGRGISNVVGGVRDLFRPDDTGDINIRLDDIMPVPPPPPEPPVVQGAEMPTADDRREMLGILQSNYNNARNIDEKYAAMIAYGRALQQVREEYPDEHFQRLEQGVPLAPPPPPPPAAPPPPQFRPARPSANLGRLAGDIGGLVLPQPPPPPPPPPAPAPPPAAPAFRAARPSANLARMAGDIDGQQIPKPPDAPPPPPPAAPFVAPTWQGIAGGRGHPRVPAGAGAPVGAAAPPAAPPPPAPAAAGAAPAGAVAGGAPAPAGVPVGAPAGAVPPDPAAAGAAPAPAPAPAPAGAPAGVVPPAAPVVPPPPAMPVAPALPPDPAPIPAPLGAPAAPPLVPPADLLEHMRRQLANLQDMITNSPSADEAAGWEYQYQQEYNRFKKRYPTTFFPYMTRYGDKGWDTSSSGEAMDTSSDDSSDSLDDPTGFAVPVEADFAPAPPPAAPLVPPLAPPPPPPEPPRTARSEQARLQRARRAMGARGMAMEAARPAPEALEAEPKEAPIPDAVKKLYDEIGDKSFINMVSSPLNRDRFRKREAEYVLNRLDKIANAPKPQRPDLARRARLIADDIRTDFEIPFPEEKEPAMKYPEVAPLSNDEVQRRLAAVAEEINTEDVLPERVEELRAELEALQAMAGNLEDRSPEALISQYAKTRNISEEAAEKAMPSEFYLEHPEAKADYRRAIPPEEYEHVPKIDEMIASNNRISLINPPKFAVIRDRKTGVPYMVTNAGLLKVYNPTDPNASKDPRYKDRLLTMDVDLHQGDWNAARTTYDTLNRKDRGILHMKGYKIRKYGDVLNKQYENMRMLLNSGKLNDADEAFYQIRRYYQKMPPKYRRYTYPYSPEGVTFETAYRDMENLHRTVREDADHYWKGFKYGFGKSLTYEPNLHEGKYLYPPRSTRTGYHQMLGRTLGEMTLAPFVQPFKKYGRYIGLAKPIEKGVDG